ncbi:MAG: 4Fe-4S dicluster domain-containing protein [Desulfatibacillaceae bacterium]|nr:4Fe-4S dicluster domain-containing protein [Desulfatibacillaceae bacterium]
MIPKERPFIEPDKFHDLEGVQKMLASCIQCGTCSGSCPNAFAMDVTPRTLWRMVLTGQKEAIFQTRTFILCSSCYSCTLRCPRGLPLTEAMSALKQIASREGLAPYKASTRFYKSFLDSVRRHGKVREGEMMTLYFLSMKNPLLPLQFAPLGLRLMLKGKVGAPFPTRGKRPLESLFNKVMQLENNP